MASVPGGAHVLRNTRGTGHPRSTRPALRLSGKSEGYCWKHAPSVQPGPCAYQAGRMVLPRVQAIKAATKIDLLQFDTRGKDLTDSAVGLLRCSCSRGCQEPGALGSSNAPGSLDTACLLPRACIASVHLAPLASHKRRPGTC